MSSLAYGDMDYKRLISRDVDEFMGIARRYAEQAKLDEDDVRFLVRWMDQNDRVLSHPIIRTIGDNFRVGKRREILTRSGMDRLHRQLRQLSGADEKGSPRGPTSSVLTMPPPKLEFKGKRYCFTGTFRFGHRWECEVAVEERGGVVGNIARSTDYLVIGSDVTDSWEHSTFGRKITQAKAWIDQGVSDVAIVSEEHWVKHIRGMAGKETCEAAFQGSHSQSRAGGKIQARPRPKACARNTARPGRNNISPGLRWFVRLSMLSALLAIVFRIGWNLAG